MEESLDCTVFNILLNRSAIPVLNMELHVKGLSCKRKSKMMRKGQYIGQATVRLDFEGGAFREDQFVFGDESHGTLAAMRSGYADR